MRLLLPRYRRVRWMLHITIVYYTSFILIIYIVLFNIINIIIVQAAAVPVGPLVLFILLWHILAAHPHLLAVVVPHRRLQSFLATVEVGELVEDDGDGQRHHQGATQDAAACRQLPDHRDRHYVPITHCGHAHRPPPPAGRDGVQAHILESDTEGCFRHPR